MKRRTILAALSCAMLGSVIWAMTIEQRKEYRDKLMQIIPPVMSGPRGNQTDSFKQWIDKTNALPPDFDALPRINGLPDPLLFLDGKRTVKNAEDWKKRRAEIIRLFEEYDIGHVPPKPNLDQIVPVTPEQPNAEAAAGRGGFGARGGAPAPGSVTKVVDLKYGPGSQITTRVTLTIPPGTGPFPVLMGGQAGITSRGYIACSFNMSVDPPSTPNIGQYYPDYDFGSMGQVAFTAQMVCDYLYTLPEVDKRYIAITGYSRGGKLAAIAAMIEERITACIAGSTGVGGVLPWRSASERGSGESIESTTRSFPAWFPPKLRFFVGREDRLPIDGNLLAAAIAPRAILSFYGLSDEVGNIYGNEQSYYSAQRIFRLLGMPERNGIFQPPGHHGANDAQKVDLWLDIQFGKSNEKWQSTFLFPWDYRKWSADTKHAVDLRKFPAQRGNTLASFNSTDKWERKAADVRKSVESILGSNQGGKGGPDPAQRGKEDVVDWVIKQHGGSAGWFGPLVQKTASRSITFGQGTRADLYYPGDAAPDARLPTVIWLHGFSYPMGYMFIYRSNPDLHPILALVGAGYAVLAFDQTGHGSRTTEFAAFYDRFPQWSRMGRMVSDTRAAIDALEKESMVDASRIYLYGYSMGGMVALHTAALDSRVKGVVSICGFTPMRTDTADKGTGGLARYSVDLPLIPQLGAFIGHESQLPYDYNELIAAVAPRPVYVVQPQLDRDADVADVHAAVEQARKIYSLYNASDKLMLAEPWDYNRLPEATQDKIIEWMGTTMK
jgi:pimeloyl-ACP methyl ester carboxylesterase